MQSVMDVFQWIIVNYQAILSGLVAIATGLIAIFLLVPGEQPEKALQAFVDFVSKFSLKKKE